VSVPEPESAFVTHDDIAQLAMGVAGYIAQGFFVVGSPYYADYVYYREDGKEQLLRRQHCAIMMRPGKVDLSNITTKPQGEENG
jgi:hypothetical protein